MIYKHIDTKTGGELYFIAGESTLSQKAGARDKFFTIALNTGKAQQVFIDNVAYTFPPYCILPLFSSQAFRFEEPEDIIAWQYNRDFYCIIDHDKEVSCVGFLFLGSFGNLFVQLDEAQLERIEVLRKMFLEEFVTEDTIQKDMLQMLLKRLIIITTRLAKEQYVKTEPGDFTDRFDIIRQYNLLVEVHFKTQHQVKFYAGELNKSPKTLANLFARYHHKSPLYIIQERIITEAKRLLYYTDRSAKEIAYDLGFEDAAHFSRFFKNFTGQSVSVFKKAVLSQPQEV